MLPLTCDRRDIKKILLKKLNHRGSTKYYIQKRRSNKRTTATVYYKFKEKAYKLGSFEMDGPLKVTSGFHPSDLHGWDDLTQLALSNARNRFLKFFRELEIMQEGGL